MTNYYTHEASCSGSSFLAAGVSPEASHDSMGCHGAGLVTGQREKDGFPKQGRGLLPLKRVRPDAGRTPCEDTETHRHRGKTHMKQRQNCAPTPQGSPGAPEAGRGEEAPPPEALVEAGPRQHLGLGGLLYGGLRKPAHRLRRVRAETNCFLSSAAFPCPDGSC